jgi:serine/threonine-protein kinase
MRRAWEDTRRRAQLVPRLPPAVAAVLDRSLQHDLEQRYADARQMQEALRAARKSLTPEALASGFATRQGWQRLPQPSNVLDSAVTALFKEGAAASSAERAGGTSAAGRAPGWRTTEHGLAHTGATGGDGRRSRNRRLFVGVGLALGLVIGGAVAVSRVGDDATAVREPALAGVASEAAARVAPAAADAQPSATASTAMSSAPSVMASIKVSQPGARAPAVRPREQPPAPAPPPPSASHNPYNRRQ